MGCCGSKKKSAEKPNT